jgi:hypothetical protein
MVKPNEKDDFENSAKLDLNSILPIMEKVSL